MASSYLLHSGTSGKLSYPAKLQNTKRLKITLYVPLMQNDLIKSSICNQTAHAAWETALFCWLTTLLRSFDGGNVFAVFWLLSTISMRGHNRLVCDFTIYQTDNRNIFGLIDSVQCYPSLSDPGTALGGTGHRQTCLEGPKKRQSCNTPWGLTGAVVVDSLAPPGLLEVRKKGIGWHLTPFGHSL